MEAKSAYKKSEYNNFDVVDSETFEQIKIQSDYDSAIIREIYFSYFSEAEVMVKRIDDYNDKENFEKLRCSVHSLSGISAVVGAKKLSKIAKDIEVALRNKSFGKAQALIPILIKSYHEFKKSIDSMI